MRRARTRFVARCGVLVCAGLLACADDAVVAGPTCEQHRCITSPPPVCDGTIKTVFQAVGTCSEDPTGIPICDYPIVQQQDCALLGDKLCVGGQCVARPVDPVVRCQGVVCDERPEPACDGQVALIYQGIGSCNPNKPVESECEYAVEAALDCTLSGFACLDGGCIDPSDAPCTPNPCDIPAQGSCNGNTPTTVASVGVCTEVTVDNRPVASCAYASSETAACTGATVECYLGRCARALEVPNEAGELVVNEVMKNPASQGDEAEWFELHNPTDSAMRIDGCIVSDDGGESFAIASERVVPAASETIVPAGGYFVLGTSIDPKPNGGFVPDYHYAAMILGNTADELVLTCGGVVIDRVLWTDAWPGGTGRSMTLGAGDTATASGNDFLGAWCDAPARYGDGTNLGSPRRANPPCPAR